MQWLNQPLTLLGRANLLKMVSLPKFLYLLANSPIYIQKHHLQAIQSHLSSFLWHPGAPRLSLDFTVTEL